LKDYYNEKANSTDIEKLREVCRPVIDYLQKNYTPHCKIIIDWNSAEVLEGAFGAGYEVPN